MWETTTQQYKFQKYGSSGAILENDYHMVLDSSMFDNIWNVSYIFKLKKQTSSP